MRVKVSTSAPLPVVNAWFPLAPPSGHAHGPTPNIASFKATLCATLNALRGVSPSSLYLSMDGFELLDNSELTIVRDGDLICINKLDLTSESKRADKDSSQKGVEPVASRKRKRREPTPSSSSSESEDSTTSVPGSSDSESTSDSEPKSNATTPSLQKAQHPKEPARERAETSTQPKHVVQPSTFVPPGYGKPGTRARNLRRRLKRIHDRETTSEGGPVSGANAVVPDGDTRTPATTPAVDDISSLPSLSLRNKNKARNFKSLMNKPLPPKIIFGEQGDASAIPAGSKASRPRLIPPSSRTSLPPNLFVSSVDVEAGLHEEKKKGKMRVEYGEGELDYGDMTVPKEDVGRLAAIAHTGWDTLEKPSEKQMVPGAIVGYKALGINPMTYTPEQCLALGRVVSWDEERVVLRLLGEEVSFGGPVERGEAEEEHTWDEIARGDWRLVG